MFRIAGVRKRKEKEEKNRGRVLGRSSFSAFSN